VKSPIRILLLEDDPRDIELIQAMLKCEAWNLEIITADTREAMETALENGKIDLIISDYKMPSFDGLDALKIAREKWPGVPFIFMSATIGEDKAVEVLKMGAIDYVLKDRPARLISSIHRALKEVEENARLKQAEEQLFRAQRVESIGALANGIAHDLNNILAPILMGASMLRSKISDERDQRLLTTIEHSARRGSDLVQQILSFTRGTGDARTLIQIKHIIFEIARIMQETFPKEIEASRNVPRDSWLIKGDPTQIHQVLMNLCVNARDAMPNGGRLRMSAENIEIDATYTQMNPDARVGSYLLITVADSGSGIPREILDKIFDPFFTTKEAGKGTGLGLYTVQGIVKNHGGFLCVSSEVGKGAQFRIYLPALKVAPSEPEERKRPELPQGNGETILLVDDEQSIREVARATLEACGYLVMVASEGTEAISLYVQNKGKIDLILLDMVMPIMDGEATIRALRKIDPDVCIVHVSGLQEEAGVTGFLQKPYTGETLLRVIRNALHERPQNPAG